MNKKSIFGALLTVIASGFNGTNKLSHTATTAHANRARGWAGKYYHKSNIGTRQYYLDVHGSQETQKETIAMANAKRLRKQQRNIDNYHKGGWVRNPIVGHQFLTAED